MSGKVAEYVGKFLSKAMQTITADIQKDLKDLKDALKEQNKKINENEKDRIRWEILDFANSCHNGKNHTYDEFKHIMELNDKYKKLLRETDDENGVFDVEYEYIRGLYKEKRLNNTFLTPITKEVIKDDED